MQPVLANNSKLDRWTSRLGYSAAALTIAVAAIGPLFWFNTFLHAARGTSLRIDPIYTGGDVARTVQREGYAILIHKPVDKRGLLSRNTPFVQLTWKNVAAMPAHVNETLDVDGDGRADLVVAFDAPKDERAALHVDVQTLNTRFVPMHNVGRDSFSRMIARVNDTIVVRVPIQQ